MQQLLYDIDAIAASAGMADKLAGTMEVGEFSLGYLSYRITDGIAYEMTLSNVGDAIVVTGHASADVHGECVRCLEPAMVHVESDIEGYFALSENSDVTGMEEDEYEYVPDDGVIDLADSVYSAVVVEIPTVFLCREDCKGLCPTCGCDRNVESCDCDQQIDDMHPFAALKDFFANSGEDGEVDN